MSDVPAGPPRRAADARADHRAAGLCAACRHMRVVVSARGSRFYLCGRAATDPSYPKYPPIPVRQCAGFDPTDEQA